MRCYGGINVFVNYINFVWLWIVFDVFLCLYSGIFVNINSYDMSMVSIFLC